MKLFVLRNFPGVERRRKKNSNGKLKAGARLYYFGFYSLIIFTFDLPVCNKIVKIDVMKVGLHRKNLF